ncbi:MAG: YHS domain-containing protein, partial [Actinomycetota bacterium]|nr:YHS domain-containing protein [Actinomycetota bacterium]
METRDSLKSNDGSHSAQGAALVKDPVCGMSVALDADKPSLEYAGLTYHFCSQKCHGKFAADPAHYLAGAPHEPA